jgi:hypothetical protein
VSKFRQYHPKLHRAVKRYSVMPASNLAGSNALSPFKYQNLSTKHQIIAVATVIVMSIQNGFLRSKAKVALPCGRP